MEISAIRQNGQDINLKDATGRSLLAEKQDKLIAGKGIKIINNVISFVGGEGSGAATIPIEVAESIPETATEEDLGKVISVDGQTYECVKISIPESIAKEGYKYKYSYTSRYLNDEKNIYNRGSFYVKEPITVEFINSIEGNYFGVKDLENGNDNIYINKPQSVTQEGDAVVVIDNSDYEYIFTQDFLGIKYIESSLIDVLDKDLENVQEEEALPEANEARLNSIVKVGNKYYKCAKKITKYLDEVVNSYTYLYERTQYSSSIEPENLSGTSEAFFKEKPNIEDILREIGSTENGYYLQFGIMHPEGWFSNENMHCEEAKTMDDGSFAVKQLDTWNVFKFVKKITQKKYIEYIWIELTTNTTTFVDVTDKFEFIHSNYYWPKGIGEPNIKIEAIGDLNLVYRFGNSVIINNNSEHSDYTNGIVCELFNCSASSEDYEIVPKFARKEINPNGSLLMRISFEIYNVSVDEQTDLDEKANATMYLIVQPK